jgi:sec-independent protein translocase protein TatA
MRIGPFGVWEILIILIVVLLIFGPRRLPEMAKGLGQSVREFRKEMRNFKDDMEADDRPSTKPASSDRPVTPPVVERTRTEEPPTNVPDEGDGKPV